MLLLLHQVSKHINGVNIMESLQDMMNRVKMNAYNKKQDAKEAAKKESAAVSVAVADAVVVEASQAAEVVATKTNNKTFWQSFDENSESGMSGMNAL